MLQLPEALEGHALQHRIPAFSRELEHLHEGRFPGRQPSGAELDQSDRVEPTRSQDRVAEALTDRDRLLRAGHPILEPMPPEVGHRHAEPGLADVAFVAFVERDRTQRLEAGDAALPRVDEEERLPERVVQVHQDLGCDHHPGARDHVERALVERDRLVGGERGRRLVAGSHQEPDGVGPPLRPFVMVGERLVLLGQPVRVQLVDRVGHDAVELLAPLQQQALVGDVVRERVLEHVHELRIERALEDEIEGAELPHAVGGVLRERRGPLQQPQRELAPDHRGRLDRPLRILGQTIEPRHDHALHRVGDIHVRDRPREDVVAILPSDRAGLDERLRDLLHVEGVPLRLAEDELLELRWEPARPDDRLGDLRRLTLGERPQTDMREVRRVPEGLRPTGAVRYEEQDPVLRHDVDQVGEELGRRGVDPVRVLDRQDEWPPCGGRHRDGPQRLERRRLPQPRIHRRHLVVPGREEMLEERDIAGIRAGERDAVPQLAGDGLVVVGLLDPVGVLHHVDDREVGDLRPVGDAATDAPRGVLVPMRPPELVQQPGLADPGVARDERDLPGAGPHQVEELVEGRDLPLAAHERAEAAVGPDVDAGADAGRPLDLVDVLAALAFELQLAHVAQHEVALDQLAGGVADRHRARGRRSLDARPGVHRVAHREVVHREVDADVTDHHGPAVQTDAEAQIQIARLGKLPAVGLERRLDVQRGASGALRVILVGDRRPEEREEPVAEELGDRPLVTMDLVQHQIERALQDRPHVLRVEPLGHRRRSDHVGVEHGDLLALPLELRAARPDLVGERRRRICLRRREPRHARRHERAAAFGAEARVGGVPVPAGAADRREGGAASRTELRVERVRAAAGRTGSLL